jgi:DnaJ-class molecular chaperone
MVIKKEPSIKEIRANIIRQLSKNKKELIDCERCLGTGEGFTDQSLCDKCNGRGYLLGVRQ